MFTSLFSYSIADTSSACTESEKGNFVIVDGIPADVIEKVETPTLDLIASQGRFLKATVGGKPGSYNETPTISAVGYNSLLTGTWANKHNVWDNDIKKPNYYYPSIFRLLKDQYPRKKIAVFSTWEDNRTKLIGEGLAATKNIRMDLAYDGLEKDTTTYPHDTDAWYIHLIDEAVIAHASASILKDAPDLSWVYLEYTDDMGHRYGDSDRFYNAVKIMDAQVSKLWQAITERARTHNEDWQIYITTDHGRDSITGKGHGRQSRRERSTWIVTNANDINPYHIRNEPAIVDIMPGIARHLQIAIPRAQQMEIDGIPLTGNLSAADLRAERNHNKLSIKWNVIDKSGSAKVWIATDNKYALGKKEIYKLVATVPVIAGQATIDISQMKSPFYKIVIECPFNMLNCWIK